MSEEIITPPVEKNYEIRFLDAILHHVVAGPLPPNHDKTHSNLEMTINVHIYQQQVQALLQITYILLANDDENSGYELQFGILGSLRAAPDMPETELAQYAKLHSLTFLWPYAREYTSDLIRRMAIDAPPLPIINPQVVTRMMVEEGHIEVEILDE